ncbi:MAG: PEP-CTERM sorting domain-containing protein [Phycisphaerales bacterium]
MLYQTWSVGTFVALTCAGVCCAVEIPLANPGFETPALLDGHNGGFLVTPGWGNSGGVGYGAWIVNPTTTQFSGEAPEGENAGVLVSYNSAVFGQTLSETYVEGETYTLTALVGDPDDYSPSSFVIGLYANTILRSTGGSGPVPADDTFTRVTATVVATAAMDGLPIQIQLRAGSGPLIDPDQVGGGTSIYFDDVHLYKGEVPEPSTLVLAGTLAGLFTSRRRMHGSKSVG